MHPFLALVLRLLCRQRHLRLSMCGHAIRVHAAISRAGFKGFRRNDDLDAASRLPVAARDNKLLAHAGSKLCSALHPPPSLGIGWLMPGQAT